MSYLYGDITNGKAGDIVERVTGLSVLKQDLYILEQDVKRNGISSVYLVGHAGSYDGHYFKLVRTNIADLAKKGDKVICTKISSGYGSDPVIGKTYEIMEDAYAGSSSINTNELHYHDYDFKLLMEDIREGLQFSSRLLGENIIVNCNTIEQAKNLLDWANSHDKRWGSEESFLINNEWTTHGIDTCYDISIGEYCNYDHYDHHNYNIWTYEDALLNLKFDDVIEVWDSPDRKYRRYFSHFDSNGTTMAFADGQTSKETSTLIDWPHSRVIPQG